MGLVSPSHRMRTLKPRKLVVGVVLFVSAVAAVSLVGASGGSFDRTENTLKFQQIYDDKYWGEAGNGSGAGSSLHATKRVRLIIELLVVKYHLKGMVDAPCGGMLWMPLVLKRLRTAHNKDFRYFGVDVVPSVIEAHKSKWRGWRDTEFMELDIAHHPLPDGYDMIFSRDALQHLPFSTIISTLENFSKSSAKVLAVGSYKNGSNWNIDVGAYFAIDLRLPPFKLTAPMDVIDEETVDDKQILVYDVDYLKQQDFDAMRTLAEAMEEEQALRQEAEARRKEEADEDGQEQ